MLSRSAKRGRTSPPGGAADLWVAVLTIVGIGFGKLLTGPFKNSAIVRADQRVAQWMVTQRTPPGTTSLSGGRFWPDDHQDHRDCRPRSRSADRLKRWFEPIVLVASLVIEAAAFIVVTTIVARQRPDVPRLDSSPVGSSFPSGHTAAAAAYFAIAVVVFWHTRRRWARCIAVSSPPSSR